MKEVLKRILFSHLLVVQRENFSVREEEPAGRVFEGECCLKYHLCPLSQDANLSTAILEMHK